MASRPAASAVSLFNRSRACVHRTTWSGVDGRGNNGIHRRWSGSAKWTTSTQGRRLSGATLPGEDPIRTVSTKMLPKTHGPVNDVNVENLNQLLMSNKFDYVRFEYSDMHGLGKCKLVPIHHFKGKIDKGVKFSLSHMIRDPTGFKVPRTGLWYERGMGDAVTFPDLTSFRVLPWRDNATRVIVDVTVDGAPLEAHPRNIALRQIQQLESMGISLLGAHEFEFVVEEAASNDPIFFGSNCGHLLNLSRAESLVQQFLQYLPQMGLNVETVESEAGPGQLEVTYQPTNGLNIGDNGYTFKTSIKEICQKNGFNASFRSKHAETVTSSSHFCHSLWDARNSTPLMSDPENLYGMSALARHWLAGLLHHAPAMTLLMCPTINCVDRLGTSPSTPTTASWGIDNRSCAFRLHLPSDPSNGGGMFLENRIGGAGGNPYLTMAATLAAGIDGIVKQLPLSTPTEGVVPADFMSTLPTNMSDCLDAFLADDVICNAMGSDFVHCFTTLKRHEMNLHREAERSGDSTWLHTFFEHI